MHILLICFLMKFATWIGSKVASMHILLICLPNINFGCYGNLKVPLPYYKTLYLAHLSQGF